ncbi:MAG: NAD(P)H-binding protein [Pseudomonadota bacterium]
MIADALPADWTFDPGRVLITGANGQLGQRLLASLYGRVPLRALVRSERAAATLRTLAETLAQRAPEVTSPIEVMVGAYDDPEVLARACTGCRAAVHLVGIIKESKSNTFEQAHVATTRTLLEAAQAIPLERCVYLSIVGAAPGHANPCLATKGEAESLLLASSVPATVFQVPMVLGEGDYASAALRARALAKRSFVFRAASLEQPIYAGDVVRATAQALTDADGETRRLALPGPESLSRRALTARAGVVLGTQPRVTSLPIALGMAMAGLFETFSSTPPVTRAMLGVLDHDDASDDRAARDYLRFERTGLDEMLRLVLA